MFSDQHPNEIRTAIGRRTFFGAIAAAVAALGWSYFGRRQPVQAAATAVPSGPPKLVNIVIFTDAGQRQNTVTVPEIVKTDDEWRKQLSPDSFEITRNAATERPYTNENPNDHAPGVFRCICCDTALFDAATKFDSGTGWPSFWAPIAKENILETADLSLGMIRTAVSCRLCDAHLGHVFDDGPRPTGLRYCMNSLAMRFAKAT
ncbi:MAG: peptide-methionine (R)-S-oxide reductase MsrB [Candidatus Acidiferrales bacterium]